MKNIPLSGYLSCETVKYDYLVRLNRTIDYIQKHYGEDLNLEKLANIACFSKYHFHRLFRSLEGETINGFLKRFRLEKAIHKLIVDKKRSITDIALDCGFSNSQNFAKVFKSYFGVTATFIRQKHGWGIQQNSLGKSVSRKIPPPQAQGTDQTNTFRSRYCEIMRRRKAISVIISDMPSFRVAYIRRIGPYRWEKMVPFFSSLLKWSAPGGLWNEKSILIASIWNNPFVTPEDRCICDACLTIPESVKSAEGVNIQTLPGGKFAVYHHEMETKEFPETWMRLIDWLLVSDYQPDERPSYIVMHHDRLPLGKPGMVDLCLAIKSL